MQEYTTRHRSVRVTVEAVATRPPGRSRTWTAEAGHWRAEGATEKAAADALAAGLAVFLTQYRPPTVVTFRGYSAVVSSDVSGADALTVWDEQVIHPDGRVSSSYGSAANRDEAEAHARNNLAHLSTDWHDDDSVWQAAAYLEGGQRSSRGQYGPDEFLRYAAWQRAAKAAMDAGRADWHEWASEHASDFTITRPEKPANLV